MYSFTFKKYYNALIPREQALCKIEFICCRQWVPEQTRPLKADLRLELPGLGQTPSELSFALEEQLPKTFRGVPLEEDF
jgi:hypothetical protein